MFEPGNDHLELLFEFGLGTGDGGPWRRRLGDALDSPAEMVRGQLAWAVTHGMADRVRLLVEHGVDVTAPFETGSRPRRWPPRPGTRTWWTTSSRTARRRSTCRQPTRSSPPRWPPTGRGSAGCSRTIPGWPAQVRAARPALITWAAACGNPAAVEILAELGFDVNAKGRTDMPSDQPWQTALHKAAEDGNVELARTLLRLGADPDIRDQRFDSTPLGWARHSASSRSSSCSNR